MGNPNNRDFNTPGPSDQIESTSQNLDHNDVLEKQSGTKLAERYSLDEMKPSIADFLEMNDLPKDYFKVKDALENTEERFFTEETIHRLIAWSHSIITGTDFQTGESEGRIEIWVIQYLTEKGLLNDSLWEWIADNHPPLSHTLRFVHNLPTVFVKRLVLNPKAHSYEKRAAFEKNSYGHARQAYEGLEFSAEEAISLFKNGSEIDHEEFQFVLKYLLPYMHPSEQKNVIHFAVDYIVEKGAATKEKSLNDPKRVAFWTQIGKDPQKEISLEYADERLRHILTKYADIPDDLMIRLIECGKFNLSMGVSWDHIPGWAFYGEKLLYGVTDSDRKILEDADKEDQKSRYTMVENRYSKVENAEISKEQKELMVQEVKDFIMGRLNPIRPLENAVEGVLFTHISGRLGLKCLLPEMPRDVGRNAAHVYIHMGENFEEWQLEFLKEVNHGRTYRYQFYLSPEQIENDMEEDERWENGYRTPHPILLSPQGELTWDMLSESIIDQGIWRYEKDNGPLPLEIKKELMDKRLKNR